MKEIDEYFKPYRDLKSRIREKKYELEELEKEKNVLEDNHIKDIYKIDNEKYRTVLRSYFINDLSIERISALLKVSSKHVYKLKAKAEESLYEMILNDTN